MNIFRNRPLFTSCMLFLGMSTLSYFLPSEVKFAILAIFGVSLIVSVFMFLLANITQVIRKFLLNAILCSLAIALSMGISLSFFNANQAKFEEMYGNEYTLEATVISKNYESEYFSTYDILVTKVNGEPMEHSARLTCEYAIGADVGQTVILRAIADIPEDESDAIFNEKLSMLSDGEFVTYTSYDGTGVIITDFEGFNVKLFFAKINKSVSEVITDRVSGEAGNLSSAILLGNKQLLSNTTKRDFARAGVSHILALSGMHMSIIMGAVTLLLWQFTRNSRKIGIIASVVAVFYLALTGFSVSALRSVIMLLVVYATMIFVNEPDPLTSLGIAGAVIVALMPGSILDAGFWMSFAATFGLLVFMPPFHKFLTEKLYEAFKGKYRKQIVHSIVYVSDIIVASVFAIIPLIIVMCIFIKEMSWFTVIASAALSLPASALILLSLLLACFHYVPYLWGALAYLIELVSGFMLDFCEHFSLMENATFSLNYPFITIAAIIMGLALLFALVTNFKRKSLSLVPFLCSILLLFGIIGIYENINSTNVKATYINASSTSEAIVLSNKNEVVICDISNGSKSTYYDVLDEVYNARATEIRAIMMTGYTNLHASTFIDIFSSEIVRELWLPYPENSDEYYKMVRIYDIASEYGVKTFVYHDGDVLTVFDDTRIQVFQDRIKRSKVPITLMDIKTPEDRLVYVSPAFNEAQIKEQAEGLFAKSDIIIFGHKGPKVKVDYTIENSQRVDAIIFTSEALAAHFDTAKVHGAAYFYAEDKIDLFLDK